MPQQTKRKRKDDSDDGECVPDSLSQQTPPRKKPVPRPAPRTGVAHEKNAKPPPKVRTGQKPKTTQKAQTAQKSKVSASGNCKKAQMSQPMQNRQKLQQAQRALATDGVPVVMRSGGNSSSIQPSSTTSKTVTSQARLNEESRTIPANDINKELEKTLQTQSKVIAEKTEEIRKLEESSSGQQKALQSYKDRCRELRNGSKGFQHQVNELMTQNKELRIQKNAAEREKSKQDLELIYLRKAVREAQEAAFKLQDQAEWMPEQASDIRGQLDSLEKRIRTWSKKYVVSSFGSIRKVVPEIPNIRKDFLQMRIVPVGIGFDGLLAALSDTKIRRSASALLLAAWTSNAMYWWILGNPFFFFDDLRQNTTAEEHKVPGRVRKCIRAVFDEMGRCHVHEPQVVNDWRSQTLRLLDPQASTPSSNVIAMKDNVANAKSRACRDLAETFIKQAQKLLTDPGSVPMKEQLVDIFSTAGNMSYKLWAQRNRLQHVLVPQIFKSGNDGYMEYHPLHSREMAENEEALEGRTIVLVAHPGLAAKGSSDGRDLEVTRVLKAATVWMGVAEEVKQQ